MKNLPVVAAASVLLCTLASAGEHSPNVEILGGNPIYKKYCAKCHGRNAEGRRFSSAPSLVSEKIAAAPIDELRATIANGRGHMPKFGTKISAPDLDALVQQIKTANNK